MTKVILTPTSPSVEKIEIMAQNMIRVYYRSGRIEPFNVSKEVIENLQLKDEQSWKRIHGFKFKENLQTEHMSESNDWNECEDSEYINCPHCGFAMFIDESHYYGLEEEEDKECDFCEKPFIMKCNSIVHEIYFSAKKEVKKKHEL